MFQLFILFLFTSTFLLGATPLQEIKNCKFVPTDWADGDSFLIRTPDGKEHTVRLYGADCLESQIHDKSDSQRLNDQRRYFGITEVDPDPRTAIDIAKNFGKQAAGETAKVLSEPFTIHTSFADARGDGRYKRIYVFVITSEGKDLTSHLVSEGLARAFGVYRETFKGVSRDDYQDRMRDLELQAAKRGKGIWARTDWNALPEERQLLRDEEAEVRLALDDRALPAGKKLNPNTAARDELMQLPGIGEVFANRIIEGRPYLKPDDLLKVSGIGPTTLAKIAPHLSFEPGK